MKVLLDYDEATGIMRDKDGVQVGGWTGLSSYEIESGTSPEELIKLVALGVSPDDLIKLKASGLL